MNEKLKKSIVEATHPFKKENDDNRNETEDGTATVPFHEECDGNQAGSCQPHAGISLPSTPTSLPLPDNQHHNNDSLPSPIPGAVAVRGIGEDGMGWMSGDSTMSASATMEAPSTVTNSSRTPDTDASTRIQQESLTSGSNNASQQLVEVAVAVELAEDIEEENEELKRSLEVERKQRQRIESLVSHAVTVNGEEVPNSTNTNTDVKSSMRRCNNNTMTVASLILLLLGVAIVLGVTLKSSGNVDVESPPPPVSAPTTTGSSLHKNKTIAPPWSCTCKDLVGSFLTLQLWDVVDPVALSSETALTIFDELFGRDEWVSNHGFQEHMGAQVVASGETTAGSFEVNSSYNDATIMLMNIFQSNTSLNFVEAALLSFTSDKPSLNENMAVSSNATGNFLKCEIAFQISNIDCSIPLSNIDEYYLRISHWKLSLNNKEDFWSQMIPASIVNEVDWYDHDCNEYYCGYEEGVFGFPHSFVVEYFGCQQDGTDDVFFFSVTSEDVDFASKEGPFLRQISGNRIEEVGSVVGAISFDHTCVKETLEFCVDNSCESDQDCAGIDSVCVFDSCAEGLGKVSEHCPCLEDSDCEQGACESPIYKCVGVEYDEEDDSASRTGCANHAVYSFLFLGLLGFLI